MLIDGGPLILIEGDPLTLMEGADGVTDIDGAFTLGIGLEDGSFTDMLGTVGDGAFTLKRPRPGALTEMEGVSWTEIVGTGGAGVDLERAGGA